MTFDDILEQVIALLKHQGRVSYSALRRRFDLDDAYLEDLKDELLFTHPVVDEGGRGLVWTGETETPQEVDFGRNRAKPKKRMISLLPSTTGLRKVLIPPTSRAPRFC